MSRLHEQYSNQIKDAMMKKFEYSNIMQVPKLEKIVINMGVGEAKENKTESSRNKSKEICCELQIKRRYAYRMQSYITW